MTIANPASCLVLYLTVEHFRGELQHAGHAGGQKIKCRPIRTRKEGGIRLQEELYGNYFVNFDTFDDHFKKMKFSIKDFSCKCDQIRRKLRIWSNFLKKYLMENFFFCVADAIKKVTTLTQIFIYFTNVLKPTLREKCPNRELFLVLIFLYSVQIQENRDQK